LKAAGAESLRSGHCKAFDRVAGISLSFDSPSRSGLADT